MSPGDPTTGQPKCADDSALARQEAEAAERSEPPMVATCRAIVGMAVGLGVEPEDRSRTWKADAEEALKRGRRAQPALLCHPHFVGTPCLLA